MCTQHNLQLQLITKSKSYFKNRTSISPFVKVKHHGNILHTYKFDNIYRHITDVTIFPENAFFNSV